MANYGSGGPEGPKDHFEGLKEPPNDSPEFAKALKKVRAEIDAEHTQVGGVAIQD